MNQQPITMEATPQAELTERPTDLLLTSPAQARKVLERIAIEAHVQAPTDWRIPVRAVLDSIFYREPSSQRRYRTRERLCMCGCGTVIKPAVRPGQPPKYLNEAHRQRGQRLRNAAKLEAAARKAGPL